MNKWLLEFASYKHTNDIFESVKSGKKTIETRAGNPGSKKDYARILPGDILVMKSLDTNEVIEKEVVYCHSYNTVEEMAESEDPGKIIPGVNNKSELLAAFSELKKKWGKRYAEKLDKHGIVAIGFK